MKTIIIDMFGNNRQSVGDFVPRIGDQVDFGYVPAPTVFRVLLFPTKETLEHFHLTGNNFDAIVLCQ
jgi:hypothetical protein